MKLSRKPIGNYLLTWFCLFIITAAPISFANAQSSPVSLEECIRIAMQNNPDLKYAAEEHSKSKYSYNTRVAEARPQIGARFWQAQGDDRAKKVIDPATGTEVNKTDASGNTEYEKIPFINFGVGVEFSYPLFNKAQSGTQEIYQKYIIIAQLNEKRTRDNVVTSIKRSYYECISLKHYSEMQEKMVQNQEKRFAAIRVLVSTGDRPIVEQSSAEVSLSQTRLDYQKIKNNESVQKSELKASMGIVMDSTDFSVGSFPEKLPVLKYSLDEMQKLIPNSTEYKIAEINTEVQQSRIRTIRKSHLPTIDLFGGYRYENKNLDYEKDFYETFRDKTKWSPRFGVGVNAQLSIYNGGRIESSADEAIADYNKSLYEQQKITIRLRKELTNGYNKLMELRQQIDISRLNLENARVNYSLAQKSYQAGIRDLRSLQDAELSLLSVEYWAVGAKKEYYQTLAMLAGFIGVDEEVLCEK